ncbi:uncharacterized protein LOC112152834 [Oryzias melastigma]|uniref:uncharacterized protein LOC112152834 n=1 Tax=Oryzias melastigma TaxID=30732 RepID=UPI000CF7E11C|nr:uncharacterized protein LOC112152834 [Oryzias melastigma]
MSPPHPVWIEEALHTHGECFSRRHPPWLLLRGHTLIPAVALPLGFLNHCVCFAPNEAASHSMSPLPPLFYLKSSGHMEEEECVIQKKLKRRSLSEHAAPTQNSKACTERFPCLWEDISLIQTGLSVSADASSILQRDIEALLSTCTQKEALCKEVNESVQRLLSQACCDFQKTKATRLLLLEDVKKIDASLGGIRSDYSHRLEQLEALKEELKSEQLFLHQVMSSLHPEAAAAGSSRKGLLY